MTTKTELAQINDELVALLLQLRATIDDALMAAGVNPENEDTDPAEDTDAEEDDVGD